MNLMGLIIAAGPALAPTIGGLTMELAGWHAIFMIMLAAGFIIVVAVQLFMHETVSRDLSRISVTNLMRSYGTLLRSPYFVTTSLVIAGSVGALYTQATILPFILMDKVGLTPSQFGFGMLMQSGLFFAGSLSVHFLMRRTSAWRLVPVGLGFIATASLLIPLALHFAPLSFISVMAPVSMYSYGIAFVMPAMLTASLAPFPHIAGSASSLGGFMQMGAGLLGGSAAALIGEPVLAMSIVLPVMGGTAILAWLFWRRLPAPGQASAVHSK